MAEEQDKIVPSIPVDFKTLKTHVRKGLSSASRVFWWPILPTINSNRIDTDPDSVACATRLASILKEPLLDMRNQAATLEGSTEINPEALDMLYRNLAYVLVQHRKLEQETLGQVEVLLKLLLCTTRRIDLACFTACTVLGEPARFGRFDFKGSYALNQTFLELLSSFCPKTHTTLHALGALDNKYLDLMFSGFFTELLPPHMVYILVDTFLLEGIKILLRFALGLVFAYKPHIKVSCATLLLCLIQSGSRGTSYVCLRCVPISALCMC